MTETADALRYIAQQVREAVNLDTARQAIPLAESLLKGARDEYGAFAGVEFLGLRQILDRADSRYTMFSVFAWLCDHRNEVGVKLPRWETIRKEMSQAESNGYMYHGYALKPYLPALADLIDREADRMADRPPRYQPPACPECDKASNVTSKKATHRNLRCRGGHTWQEPV